MRLLVATRNPGKVREIREILAGYPEIEIAGLEDLGIEETPDEDALEVFETFEENALAKARWFAAKTGELTLADDSGICVDALGGAPGVRSRRFAGEEESRGLRQDEANNRHLLRMLDGLPPGRRTARYVCAAALADAQGRESVYVGTCDGVVLDAPRGSGGFGYDPLFWLPAEGMTFGELPPARKNAVSHRGKAVRAAIDALRSGWRGE
ncbi:MAG TPA: RdgB/HAM1 family non-canonical purine NTP pyrophosphatase [Longimicrobium sp.]|nr:RdgB/HAM1 family non-canonical purine NTP pyrophosphatase [Longimicrobium sp.]HSU17589.1 RdgB/HAM1 family non-canonical purine NTP pyrophosphatase [Longimicrobium sp.]